MVSTLPKTNSSPKKIGHTKRKKWYSNHPFSGAMLVSGRVVAVFFFFLGGVQDTNRYGEDIGGDGYKCNQTYKFYGS